MDASDTTNTRKYPTSSSQTPPTFAVPCDRSAVPYLSLECKESPSPSSPHWRTLGTAFESPFRRYGGIGSMAQPISVGRTRADGSLKPLESSAASGAAPQPLVKADAVANSFCYNSPPQSAILMSPSSALLPKDTPNVKFRMELASQIQDSPSSLAHIDANLMLNIGDTPNDKIRYAYRFGDDFGGASPGTESASSVQRFIRGMPRAFAFANTDSHRSESGSPTSDGDAQYTLPDHNLAINEENSELVATFGQSRLAAGTPVNESAAMKSKLRFCSCRRSLCLKLYCECFSTGRLCSGQCKCNNCHNDVAHAEERMAAARHILQRNPTAFSPKIQEDGSDARLAPTPTGEAQLSHVRGCHCKKSGCLKRYCECFQAGVICGPHCKCTNCLNTNAAIFFNPDPSNGNAAATRAATPSSAVPGDSSPIDHRVTPRAPGPVRLIPLFDSSPSTCFERRACGLDAMMHTAEHPQYFTSSGMPFTAIPSYLDHTMSPSSTTSRRRTRLDFESSSRDVLYD